MTLALTLYRVLSAALAKPIARRDARRLARGGVAPERRRERLGHATRPRPSGKLVWINAVSVGETHSAMGVIRALTDDGINVLLTTTTATAARTAAAHLPQGAVHQFAPIDTPRAVARFLDHWEPNLAVFVESDIWPRQLRAAKSRGIPLALINARLSKTSLRNWHLIRRSARRVLGNFDRVYCQNADTARALRSFVAPSAALSVSGDLKASALPLPCPSGPLQTLRDAVGSRPVWAALSTHEGEEEIILEAHRQILSNMPDALLILAPRHPDRGREVATLIRDAHLRLAQRSQGGLPAAYDQVYLADTLGELGLWFALAPRAFIGASLIAKGGHNPYEALPFGTLVLTGPYVVNFAAAYDALIQAGAARMLPTPTAPALCQALGDLTLSPAEHAVITSVPPGDPDLPADIARDLLELMGP